MKGRVQSALLGMYSALNKAGLFKLDSARFVFEKTYAYYKRGFEDPFAPFVRNHPEVFRHGHVLDVGANIGYTAGIFAKALAPGFSVHAFEPDEESFSSLRNVARRYEGRIVENRAAVGESSGSIRFWHNGAHSADHRVVTANFETQLRASVGNNPDVNEVALVRLDDYATDRGILDRIVFVKIDVQGFEVPVLRGMRTIVERNPNLVVAFEYAPLQMSELGFSPEMLWDCLQENRLNIYVLSRKGRCQAIDRGEIESALSKDGRGYIDLIAVRGGIG